MDDHDSPMFARSRVFEREFEMFEKLLREREIAAAEKSARWAMVSMVVSALALLLSAWPYVRGWLA